MRPKRGKLLKYIISKNLTKNNMLLAYNLNFWDIL